jgi:NAD-dependent deacetylase
VTSSCNQPFPDTNLYEDATALPTCDHCGQAIRPHIVWFGEIPLDLDAIYAELDRATHLLVIGTSGNVYPAAGFVSIARRNGTKTIYLGPEPPSNAASFDEILLGAATEMVPTLL